MKHRSSSLRLLPLAAAAVLAACASLPAAESTSSSPVAAPDCAALAEAAARAQDDRRQAAQASKEAWRAVVPFVVAARYSSAKADSEAAEQRLAAVDAQRRSQGCERHGD